MPATRSPTLPPRDARADGDDFARAIGAGHERRRQIARPLRFEGDEVAIVERHRAHAHQHFARARFGRRLLDERESVHAAMFFDRPRLSSRESGLAAEAHVVVEIEQVGPGLDVGAIRSGALAAIR